MPDDPILRAAVEKKRGEQKPSLIGLAFQVLSATRSGNMPETVVAKSAVFSKINWTQFIGLAATAAAWFGLPVTSDQLLAIFVGVQTAVAVITAIFRTFGNKTLPPEFAGRTITVMPGPGVK